MNCILLYFFNWDVCPIGHIVILVKKKLVTEERMLRRNNIGSIRDNYHKKVCLQQYVFDCVNWKWKYILKRKNFFKHIWKNYFLLVNVAKVNQFFQICSDFRRILLCSRRRVTVKKETRVSRKTQLVRREECEVYGLSASILVKKTVHIVTASWRQYFLFYFNDV